MKRTAPFALALAALLMPAPAPATEVVNVANVSRTLFSMPFWVAQHRGFLKAEGLETTSNILDSAEKINAALRAGTMQIAMGTPEAVIMDAYKGGPLRLIAGNTGKLPHFIIARPHIKTLKDLRGANFGILSEKEGSTYVVQDIAKAIGLTPADYTMTAVGGAPTRWKLLREGKIDAGLQPFPLSYESEAAGFSNQLQDVHVGAKVKGSRLGDFADHVDLSAVDGLHDHRRTRIANELGGGLFNFVGEFLRGHAHGGDIVQHRQ